MNKGRTARWSTRFIGVAMIVVALLAFRVMERQLERIGEAAQRVESRVDAKVERAAPGTLPQPATARLPQPATLPGERASVELDSKGGAPTEDPSRAAREEALPEPGVLPEGAIW